MKLAVVGSRLFKDKALLCKTISEMNPTEIISGGAIGADTFAEEYAKENNIPFVSFLPEYRKYGRSAPIIRNKLIVDRADRVVAFWDGKSAGTKFVIDYAQKTRKPIKVILFQ